MRSPLAPNRDDALARIRAGTLVMPQQIVERYRCSLVVAHAWLREARGEPERERLSQATHRPRSYRPRMFRCACLHINTTPVCARCGEAINPILAKELT